MSPGGPSLSSWHWLLFSRSLKPGPLGKRVVPMPSVPAKALQYGWRSSYQQSTNNILFPNDQRFVHVIVHFVRV